MMLNLDPSRTLLGWLGRHGELNIDNRWDGWGNYVLSPEGRQSAEKMGQWLSYQTIGRIICSDLPRTVQTAEIIMNQVDVMCPHLGTEPNLRAWAIGDFTGKEKTDERKAEFRHYREHPDVAIPGGESYDQLCQRVKIAFQYFCSPYHALPTLILTHNSVLKALMELDETGDLVEPGGLVAVYMDEKGDISFDVVLGKTDMDKAVGLDASCG